LKSKHLQPWLDGTSAQASITIIKRQKNLKYRANC